MKNDLRLWVCWSFGIASFLIYSIEIMSHTPLAEFGPKINENFENAKKNSNKNCCIITSFDSFQLESLQLLGYSMKISDSSIPKTFAFSKNKINAESREKLEKYFNFVDDISNATKITLDGCFPIVSVSPLGFFNRSPWDVCNNVERERMPLSVPNVGDVVYPDKSMVVFDLNATEEPFYNAFGDFKGSMKNWSSLPSFFSVKDYKNDFLDFWLSYSSPIYIHYDENTFQKVVNGEKNNNEGSPLIYKMLKKMYANSKKSMNM